MTGDARFEDGQDRPLRLRAEDGDDLTVISSLVQDAVFPITEMKWDRSRRRFALLLNRFRWEDRVRAERRGDYERVRSVLVVDDALAVATRDLERADRDTILSLLAIDWHPGEDGTGRIELLLAGDGAIGIEVEALDVTLQDVTRPYLAPSGKAPTHAT